MLGRSRRARRLTGDLVADPYVVCARVDAKLMGVRVLSLQAQILTGKPIEERQLLSRSSALVGDNQWLTHLTPRVKADEEHPDLHSAIELWATSKKVLERLSTNVTRDAATS